MRLIDVEVAEKNWWQELRTNYADDYGKGFQAGLLAVIRQPTIEAEPVKHGRWEDVRDCGSGGCYGFCSNCNTGHRANNPTALKMEYRHCRWCGAKMDGGTEC